MPVQRRGKHPPPRKKACDNCTKSKVRCGLEKPSCSRCKASGRTCEYPAQNYEHASPVGEPEHATPSGLNDLHSNTPITTTSRLEFGVAMPGLPLSYSSPSGPWNASPRLRRARRSHDSEDLDDTLDLSKIELVPCSNAEDIRDRWLRPYILPPLGNDEIPKAYHPFTLQYVSRILRTYPQRMLKDGGLPPIIHRAQISTRGMPRALANCYSLVRMWENAVSGSEAMVVDTIEKEMDRLMEEIPNRDDHELLSSFQAYLIYSVMLYFSFPNNTSPITDKTMITLMELAFRTAQNGLFCAAELSHTRPTWESWIIVSAKRRAIFAMYMFCSVYNSDRLLPNFIADEIRGVYVPGNKVLWEANNRETWEREYDRHLIDWEDGMFEISELWRSAETGTPERRARIERWVGTVDEFGMMLFAVTAHIHGC